MAGCGVQLPIITLGQRGAAFLADGVAQVARCQIAEPRILVGAGDVFAAALAVGLDERRDDPVELVSWASAVAGAYVSGEAMGDLRAAATALLDRVEIRPAEELKAWGDRGGPNPRPSGAQPPESGPGSS
jgi:fructose-1-phosphate kinase PfkB-like protein